MEKVCHWGLVLKFQKPTLGPAICGSDSRSQLPPVMSVGLPLFSTMMAMHQSTEIVSKLPMKCFLLKAALVVVSSHSSGTVTKTMFILCPIVEHRTYEPLC